MEESVDTKNTQDTSSQKQKEEEIAKQEEIAKSHLKQAQWNHYLKEKMVRLQHQKQH